MLEPGTKNSVMRQDVPARFIHLIDIYHESFGHSFYTDFSEGIEVDGRKYEGLNFTFTKPEVSDSSVGNGSLVMEDAGLSWIERIRNFQMTSGAGRFTLGVSMLIVFPELERSEEVYHDTFMLDSASYDGMTVSWNVVFDDNWDILIPVDVCNPTVAPGAS